MARLGFFLPPMPRPGIELALVWSHLLWETLIHDALLTEPPRPRHLDRELINHNYRLFHSRPSAPRTSRILSSEWSRASTSSSPRSSATPPESRKSGKCSARRARRSRSCRRSRTSRAWTTSTRSSRSLTLSWSLAETWESKSRRKKSSSLRSRLALSYSSK